MAGEASMLLGMVQRTNPGNFIDGRLMADPVNAIVYRMRNPIVDELSEVPTLQQFGIFKVSAILSNRVQVGVCVRFAENVIAKVTQGDFASFVTERARKNMGIPTTAMKTPDFLIFEYSSRGALLLKKLEKGRGYGG